MASRVPGPSVPRVDSDQDSLSDKLGHLPCAQPNLGYLLVHWDDENGFLLPSLLRRLADRRLVNVSNILPPVALDYANHLRGGLRMAFGRLGVYLLHLFLKSLPLPLGH